MKITIKNNNWVDFDDSISYSITAVGDNGNIIKIDEIHKRYLIKLYKDILKGLEIEVVELNKLRKMNTKQVMELIHK